MDARAADPNAIVFPVPGTYRFPGPAPDGTPFSLARIPRPERDFVIRAAFRAGGNDPENAPAEFRRAVREFLGSEHDLAAVGAL